MRPTRESALFLQLSRYFAENSLDTSCKCAVFLVDVIFAIEKGGYVVAVDIEPPREYQSFQISSAGASIARNGSDSR